MPERRSSVVLFAVPSGLLLGVVAWQLVISADHAGSLAALEEGAAALSRPMTLAVAPARLAGPPLFALTTGTGSVRDVQVALSGISRMPGRSAALLAIDGKPGVWVGVGEVQDGVIVREVTPASVTLDTPLATLTLRLGERSGGAPAAPAAVTGPSPAAGPPPAAVADTPPPGYRLPPAPASAPGADR